MNASTSPLDGPGADTTHEGLEVGADPVDDPGLLARYRKAIATVIGIPVAWLFVNLGLDGLLGVKLSDGLEIGAVALIVEELVRRIPNAD